MRETVWIMHLPDGGPFLLTTDRFCNTCVTKAIRLGFGKGNWSRADFEDAGYEFVMYERVGEREDEEKAEETTKSVGFV